VTRLRRRDFLKLCGTSSVGLALAACGVAPSPTVAPTLTNIPAPTATSTPTLLPTSTAIPTSTPKPTLSPDKIGGLTGIPLPSQTLIEQGIKDGIIRQKVEAGQLTFEVKDNLNRSGTKIVFGRDPATKDIVLATRLNTTTQEYEWSVARLRDLADAVGLKVGALLSSPYYSSSVNAPIDQLVVAEFNAADIPATSWQVTEPIRQGVFDLGVFHLS